MDGLKACHQIRLNNNQNKGQHNESCCGDLGDLGQLCVDGTGTVLAEEGLCGAAQRAAQTVRLAGLEQDYDDEDQAYDDLDNAQNQL